ncbi:hypothetical protein [Eubacterium sp.]|uniref:hypothetical protein n=1 Tax=Eubacterium sp. TaxID=142586 RepID=UPI0026E021D7|nr:hypothetical protein [Eubacterium sp.]MDO5433905.1 hypothetical protein [Eubacterium sp.]
MKSKKKRTSTKTAKEIKTALHVTLMGARKINRLPTIKRIKINNIRQMYRKAVRGKK